MADTKNGPDLYPVTEELATGKNFAAVTTVLPSGLLQGLLRCGHCGRIMQVGYSGTHGDVPRYVCARAHQLYASERTCQSIGGLRLEHRVLAEMFTSTTRRPE